MGKRTRRRTKRRPKKLKGGMKKITPTQFKKSRLELKKMLKDKDELNRTSSSSSDELSPKTDYLWKRAMPQKGELEKVSSKELTPRLPSTPRFEDDDLGSPDEDIELKLLNPVNRLKPIFGLRIYKNISEKGTISTPNWTLVNGTFDPKQFGKGGWRGEEGMGSFKFINQTNFTIRLVIKGDEPGVILPGPKMRSHLATFLEIPFEEQQGGIKKDVMGSRIIQIVPVDIPPSYLEYQSAFNILDSDGPNPLYVLYEKKDGKGIEKEG